jgi:peptidoglycan/LPS O-acetylase OafA/YrhL
MQYRREIDGLRAVAVLPVILFHAGISMFSGGFVGVDVFFVISGYLITTIIVSERREERFSILRFYERRARRILPALFLVLACSFPFAWLWMSPAQFSDFGRSLAATALFISNVHFWEHTGYFAPDAEIQPLLHTWSLAVEEQYYLVFPLILLMLGRFRPWVYTLVIASMALASLALSEWGWRNEPDANFFFTLSRFWELLVGSLCAIALLDRRPWRSNLLSLFGLGLIVGAILGYDDTVQFPSLWALAPVGGTALIILFARSDTIVATVLSLRGFVGIGLISYSAYLWHQPIFAFARIRSLVEPAPALMLGLALVSLILAGLSWRLVEQPVRRRRNPVIEGRVKLLSVSAAGIVAVFALGLAVYFKSASWQPWPLDPRVLQAGFDRNDRLAQCLPLYDGFNWRGLAGDCSDIKGQDRVNVALIGDSHADQFARALRDSPDRRFNFYQFTVNSCPPFDGLRANNRSCDRYKKQLQRALNEIGIDVVIIASRWTSYATGRKFDNGEGGVEKGNVNSFILDDLRPGSQAFRDALVARFQHGVETYLQSGYKVVLVHPVPEAGWNVPKMAFKLTHFQGRSLDDIALSTSHQRFRERNLAVISAFRELNADNLIQVRPAEALCDTLIAGRCANIAEGRVLYYDDDHLSTAGAGLVVPSILSAVEALAQH